MCTWLFYEFSCGIGDSFFWPHVFSFCSVSLTPFQWRWVLSSLYIDYATKLLWKTNIVSRKSQLILLLAICIPRFRNSESNAYILRFTIILHIRTKKSGRWLALWFNSITRIFNKPVGSLSILLLPGKFATSGYLLFAVSRIAFSWVY